MKRILIPTPTYGFDPTEVSVPWKELSSKGLAVTFATPRGTKASADQIMISGAGLGPLGNVLRARWDAVSAYEKLNRSDEFLNPISYDEIHEVDFDALLLPGGHDKGVREYLESAMLQETVARFFLAHKPVAAICHGVVLASRSKDPFSGNSVLYDFKTTALLSWQERAAYRLTQPWRKDYYLTYPGTTVEMEVTSVLRDRKQFVSGPAPLRRDDPMHLNRGFALRDRNYVSARWPGDAYRFTFEFLKLLHIEDRN